MPVSAKNANGMSFFPNSAGIAMISENDRDRDHRVERDPVAVHPAEDRPARDRPVARERVPGARGAGQARRAAEELADGRDQDHQLRRPGVERAGEDRAEKPPRVVDGRRRRWPRTGSASSTNQPITAEQKIDAPDALGGAPSPRRGSPRPCGPRRRSRSACTSSAGSRPAAPGTRSRGRRWRRRRVPVLLIRSPKTKLVLWWSSGTKISSAMMIATPSRCQPTETLFISARKRSAKMLTSV